MSRLRPALLRRNRRRWQQRRAWLKPVASARRELRSTPLHARLALRPRRTVVRSTSLAITRVTRLVRAVAPPASRSLSLIYFAAEAGHRADRSAPRNGLSRRERTVVRPVDRAYVLSTVERERTLRHVRLDIPGAAATSGERGHPGPRGRPGAGTPLPLVLQQPAPAAPLRAEAIEADAVESSALEALQVPSSVAPFAAPAPDVDALARQVLDRIERRAIAQRERMGRI